MENELIYKIVEHIGILATHPNGWRKEINRVEWNGANAKYDVREWDPSHTRMSRGITLTTAEMKALLTAMEGRR